MAVTEDSGQGGGNPSQSPEPVVPLWAEEVRKRYVSGEATLFLLHGNVHDVVAAPDGSGRFVTLREFLHQFLVRTKDVVGFYNQSQGLTFPTDEMEAQFIRTVNAGRLIHGKQEVHPPVPRNTVDALELVEEYMRIPGTHGAMIIDFLETVAPEGNIAFMGADDRVNLVTLQRWATDPELVRSDSLVVLVTENVSDVNRRLVTNPQLALVPIPLPDEEERKEFLDYVSRKYGLENARWLVDVTAGLSRNQIEGIFRQAWESRQPVSMALVRERKKAIIEQECHGLVAFVEPKHGFDQVGGMGAVKRVLRRVVRAIHGGRTSRVPMGILFVGPMGTGKTFLAEAFARESGWTCIKLKNFRGSYVGTTEANLEKIIGVVKALGNVVVIVDEADRSLSGAGGEKDGGTESRVIARLKEFMSDTTNRGRIIFMVMTNRPDKLDADLKRSGRVDVKIPFFFPEDAAARKQVFEALLKKNKIPHQITNLDVAAAATEGYSGAEIEAILSTAAAIADDDGRDQVTEEDLSWAVEDFIPSRDTAMIEYMELLAVFECSSRSLVPERYRRMTSEELNRRIRAMRRDLL